MAVVGAGKKLAWSNYTEEQSTKPGPTPNTVISAGTGLSFGVGYDEAYGTPKAGKSVLKCKSVQVEVLLAKCWVAKGYKSDALLNHEQGHYRIQELGARELDDQLSKLSVEEDTLQAAQTALKKAVDDAWDAMDTLVDEVNKLYDGNDPKGTNHGVDATIQARWDLKMKAATTLSGLKAAI